MKNTSFIVIIFLFFTINFYGQTPESSDSFSKLNYQVKENIPIDSNLLIQYSGFEKRESTAFPDMIYNQILETLYINDSILAIIVIDKMGAAINTTLWTFSKTRSKIAELELLNDIGDNLPVNLPVEAWYYEKLDNWKYKISRTIYKAKDKKYLNEDGSIKEEYYSDDSIILEENIVEYYMIDDTGEIQKQK